MLLLDSGFGVAFVVFRALSDAPGEGQRREGQGEEG